MTPLIDSLAFLGLVSSVLNQFRRDYLEGRLPEKMKTLTKNVPAKSECLFGNDLNKRINTINSIDTALTANIFPHYQYDKCQGSKAGINQQNYGSKFKKLPNFMERLCSRDEVANKAEHPVPQKLDTVRSMNVVHSNIFSWEYQTL